jgi:hypothetical protein
MLSKTNVPMLLVLVSLTICLTEVRTANAQTPNAANSAANIDSSFTKDATASDVRGVVLRVNDKNQVEIGEVFTGDRPDARTAGSGTNGVAIWPLANIQRSDGNGNTIIVWPRTGAAVISAGNGSTVIIWPRSGAAVRSDGSGNTIVVWPRSGAAARSAGNGSTVVVWPRSTPAARSTGNGNVIVVWPRKAPDAAENVVIIWPRARHR